MSVARCWFTAWLLLFGALGGCGDDPLGPTPDEGWLPDLLLADVPDVAVPDPGAEAGVEDAGDKDGAMTAEVSDAIADPGPPDEGTDPGPPDIPEPDLTPDETPPTVVSSDPAADQDGVALPQAGAVWVSVTFSEPIAANTVAAQTFKVFDPSGDELDGTRDVSEDKKTLLFTPGDPAVLLYASPYRVWLAGGIISDLAGNKLVGNHEFKFYTEGYPDMEAYEALAATYAPTIYSGYDPSIGTPQAQIPTRFDADGDWDGSNNKDWPLSTADQIVPAVYFSVAETYSHYFIHYVYFFPWVNHPSAGFAHANGVSGAMVTVQKAHDVVPERPVAVTTYFHEKTVEENMTFATTESGIDGPQSADYYGLEDVYPQDTLFPGGRYEAWITPGEHESCLWIREDQTPNCQLFSVEKPTLQKLVFAYTDGTADPIVKDTGWPKDMSEIEGEPEALGYELVSLVDTWWARRLDKGDDHLWYDTYYTYEADPDRPGDDVSLPSRFVDPHDPVDNAYGRPIWAWKYVPLMGSLDVVNQGEFGVDPAWYLQKRHASVDMDTALIPYNVDTGEGLSTKYCFNAIVAIDARQTDPLCGAAGQ